MRIFFSVGEPSGDLHGANLIRSLRSRIPNVQCMGYGGPKMAAAGAELHFDLTELAVMWIGRVLLNLPMFFRLRDQARDFFARERPDAVVLIDYPGFNWHIAAAAKKLGIPVFYYGVPQLWAWAPWRVNKMRRSVDHALCKLPFEEAWFRERGVNATFVGHPYFDEMRQQQLDTRFCDELRSAGPLVTLLPGSRTQEVKANLPAFLQTAKLLRSRQPNTRFAIASFKESQAELAQTMVQTSGVDVPVYVGRTPELIHSATACLACSGSVSLELLWHERPSVIHYKISRPFFYFARHVAVTVKYITLVNILADADSFRDVTHPYDPASPVAARVPFPEYPTYRDVTRQMATHVETWLTNREEYDRVVGQLRDLKSRFAQAGASNRAAEYIAGALATSVGQPASRNAA